MAKNTIPQASKKTPLTKAKMKAASTAMEPAKGAVSGSKTGVKNKTSMGKKGC